MTTSDKSQWKHVSPETSPPFSVFTKEINKSDKDKREYRIIELENGLQATLVHDPETDKAAASLDVAVGFLSDPDDMPGLAHFCEHLLFMGTEQFPKENEYSEYLAKHNGHSNAYTASTNTNYFFAVSTGALVGALQRFSGFFHCPLFSPSCTLRELNAVDSEHQKNHQADSWRLHQVGKHLSKPGHVWSKFGSGNRDSLLRAARELKAKGLIGNGAGSAVNGTMNGSASTLTTSVAPAPALNGSESEADGGAVGRETRRRLVEWWEHEYCASRMHLCIVGKESLDELSEMASTYFSPIKNRGRDSIPIFPEQPCGEAEKGTLVSVQTIMEFHALELSFPVEYQAPFWHHKPASFISHFTGHEGPGSLHSYLKNNGWITGLSSGSMDLARGFGTFKILIYLTEEGFSKYESVILATYQYLALLRTSTFDAYHQQEVSTLSRTQFRFEEKQRPEDYALSIAQNMVWPVPPEHLLDGPKVTWDWNEYPEEAGERKVREYLEENLRIGEGRVTLMARADEFEKVVPGLEWSEEPWYGTKYHVKKFDNAFVEAADRPNQISELFLPGPNEFIPKNLDVEKREVGEPEKRPHLIRETPLSTLWHKKDDRFWAPKAHVIIDLRSPVCNASARASVLTRMYSDLVNDALTEYAYDASLAGLSYNFLPHTTGVYVAMSGYNDKMSVLAQHVLEKIKGLTVDSERLAIMKEQAKRDYENFRLGQSYTMSEYFSRYLLTEQQWTPEEKLLEISSITSEEVQEHITSVLSWVNVRILVTGNIYKEEAIKIAEMAEDGLTESPLTPAELTEQCLILPEGANFAWEKPVPNPEEVNSSLTYYLHFGSATELRMRVVSALLAQMLTEPAFDILRTKQQLGYIVSCSSTTLPGSSERGLRVLVQSEKGPDYLEQRVEAFLEEMKTRFEEMPLEEFESQKSGLEKKWLEVDKNLDDEVGRFITHISSGHLDFLRNDKDVAFLKSVTKEDVLDLFKSRVLPSSPLRAKMSVHMQSMKPRSKKVSSKAAQEFEALLRDAALGVDEAGWKEALGDTPSTEDFANYWKGILKDKEGGEKVLDSLSGLVEAHPVDGEGDYEVLPGVSYIEDPKAFKAGLKVSVFSGPLVQWGDSPVS
ncbi:insulin-degrading enzyme [Cyathus striatus]|nr:insulin-degrading enzyme [Cyathus striatus]